MLTTLPGVRSRGYWSTVLSWVVASWAGAVRRLMQRQSHEYFHLERWEIRNWKKKRCTIQKDIFMGRWTGTASIWVSCCFSPFLVLTESGLRAFLQASISHQRWLTPSSISSVSPKLLACLKWIPYFAKPSLKKQERQHARGSMSRSFQDLPGWPWLVEGFFPVQFK